MEQLPGLEEWQQNFDEILSNNTIKAFSFLNVNPNYFAFHQERCWVLDGGVQIDFENGKSICLGWNNDMELMDMAIGTAEGLLGNLDYYELENVSNKINEALTGKTIVNHRFEWNWYQKMDENFELEEELNFAPLALELFFNDGQTLQLAVIQFSIDAKDKSLANASYLPEGDLLVSLNETIPIELIEDEPQ